MEMLLRECANYVALVAELCSVVCIAIGIAETLFRATVLVGSGRDRSRAARRAVWSKFAMWIVLALEFALAADIVRTAIAPTWDDIGRLGAIALIRTALNYFLERDMEEFSPNKDEAPESVGARG